MYWFKYKIDDVPSYIHLLTFPEDDKTIIIFMVGNPLIVRQMENQLIDWLLPVWPHWPIAVAPRGSLSMGQRYVTSTRNRRF